MESAYRKLLKNPLQGANLMSVIFFGWTIPIFRNSYHGVLDPTSALEPLAEDQSDRLGDRLEKNWNVECTKNTRPSLLRALFKTFWSELFIIGIFSIFIDCIFRLTYLFLFKQLLSYFSENSNISRDDAFIYGIVFFVNTLFYRVGMHNYLFQGLCCGMKFRVALSSIIYRKALNLSQGALSSIAPGKLVNLLSNDVQRCNSVLNVHLSWVSPLVSFLAAYILWIEIRWASIIGMAIVFLFVPIQSYAGKLLTKVRFETALRTDERIRFMDEIVSGIQVIKMYCWERNFEGLIAATRRFELKMVLKSLNIKTFKFTIYLIASRVTLFCTVLSFVWLYDKEKMTIPKMFTIAYLLNLISKTMCGLFIDGISDVGEIYVSLKRIQEFLQYEENEKANESDAIGSDELTSRHLAILMKKVSVKWNSPKDQNTSLKIDKYKGEIELNTSKYEPFQLQDINLEVPKGKLVFIVGSVGSGKSTLMQVLLRELPLIQGSLGINGTVSYASQMNWTFTSTIRQNITFGQAMNRSRYDEVIKCSALAKDFEQFTNSDSTVVGENGAGLSGGQKARINLARSMYRKADIYLIDDPLSAVDSHVQSHLFNECIGPNGYLARQNATRILITHQLHFMKEADWIVVLKDGKIDAQGNYHKILNSGFDFATMFSQNENDRAENESQDENSIESNDTDLKEGSKSTSLDEGTTLLEATQNVEGKKPSSTNTLSEGKINGSLLFRYLKSSNISCAVPLLAALFLITQIIASMADIWVSIWIKNEENRLKLNTTSLHQTTPKESSLDHAATDDGQNIWSTEAYIYIYSGIIISLIFAAILRSVLFSLVCTKASQSLHDTMFHGLISTKMQFFNENPAGRIMNRFTKDMGNADEMLPKTLMEATEYIFIAFGSISVIIFTDVKFAVVALFLGVFFIFIQKIYSKCSTKVVRLEASTKSPVFTHVLATLKGLSIVRAFQAESILREEFERHQNLNTGAYTMFLGTSYAFGLWLDMIVLLFIGVVLYVFLVVNEGVTGDRVG
ncbi:multidrug resistance-associated protein 4-like, partial [Contarinia nasturtii]|uniref:multidrug resistance-associated protein 4-like n=1 Tax=Contarinia nasturtii TaxID=265458 RepID=UPI0012D3E8F4